MAVQYYTGDNVPLRFTVSDASGAINPTVAVVSIVQPSGNVKNAYEAQVTDNEVSYAVLSTDTNSVGMYFAYFVVTLPGDLARTYKMQFQVYEKPNGT